MIGLQEERRCEIRNCVEWDVGGIMLRAVVREKGAGSAEVLIWWQPQGMTGLKEGGLGRRCCAVRDLGAARMPGRGSSICSKYYMCRLDRTGQQLQRLNSSSCGRGSAREVGVTVKCGLELG